MNYPEISKETIGYLHKCYGSLKNSPLSQSLRALVELRVSQINGCSYCCKLHTDEAKKLLVPQEKIDGLPSWQETEFFTEEERSALQWAESLTRLDPDWREIKEQLVSYFTERQIVDLTACIALMNTLNRISIALRD